MNNSQIITDGVIGFVMFSLLSYMGEMNKDKPYYYKIAAFLWAAPFTYFYLMYITSKSGSKTLRDFNRHALLGTSMTIVLILFSLYNSDIDVKYNILFSFVVTFLLAWIYVRYKLYNKM